jgi:hypothetical protein
VVLDPSQNEIGSTGLAIIKNKETDKLTMRTVGLLFIFSGLVLASAYAQATNSGVTYQGRILRPDGSPISGATTQFKLQIRTPDSNNCLMYEEVQSLDLRNTNGGFSLTINDGTGSRTDTTGLNLDRIFANYGTINFNPATCSAGSSYAPNTSDGRNLVVLFKDETMAAWEPIPAQKINFVPFAFESKQVQGFTADSLIRVVNGSGDPLTGLAPLSNAQYTELMALVNGTSTAFTKANQLGGVALPAMTSGQVLGWNGSAWVSQAAVAGANSVTNTMIQNNAVDSTKIASGAVGTSQVAGNVTINTSGTLGAALTTTRDFQIFAASPSTFYIDMQAPALAASYSLVWPLNAGSNGQVLTTNGSGVLSWAPVASSQWTTQAPGINYMGGSVGIGTTSPDAKLAIFNNATVAAPATSNVSAETSLHLVAADNMMQFLQMDAFSNTNWKAPILDMRRTKGTAAAPGNPTTLNVLGSIRGTGWVDTSYQAGAEIYLQASENWSAASHGASINMSVTPKGSTGYINVASFGDINSNEALVALGYNGSRNSTSWTNEGASLNVYGGTTVDTTGSGGISQRVATSFTQPTFASSSAVTVNNAANIYIAGPPIAGSNTTLTNTHSLYVNSGTSYLGGNVGIGTTAPTAKLNLAAGSAAASSAPLKFTTGTLMTTPEDGAMEYNSGSGLWFTIGATRYLIPTNTAAGNYSNVTNISNAGGSITMTPSAGNSVIVSQSTTSTNSSSGALVVTGGAGIGGALNTGGNITSGGSITATTNAVIPQLYGSTAPSGNIKIDGTSDATSGNVYLASAGGRVGIGTTAPNYGLHISKNASSVAQIGIGDYVNGTTNSNNGVAISGFSNGNNYLDFKTFTGGSTYFRAGEGTETGAQRAWMTVQSSTGNVGIGTAPNQKFHVASTTNVASEIDITSSAADGGNANIYLKNTDATVGNTSAIMGLNSAGGPSAWIDFININQNTAATSSGALSFSTSNAGATSQKMYISTAGNVGIGTTTPGYVLDVNGIANATQLCIAGTCKSSWPASGLTNFTEAANSTAPNATVPVVSLIATNAAANVDVALIPKGAGALTASVADSTAAGGNKRGTYAVDWQMKRAAGLRVASGNYSVIGGGSENSASSMYATVAGGNNNSTQAYSTAGGGAWNNSAGQYSTIPGGYNNIATGYYSFATNLNTTAESYSQTTFGQYNLPQGSENSTTWVAADPLFVIGNGTSSGSRANALMILKNGNVGIGTTVPTEKLSVNGNIYSSGRITASVGANADALGTITADFTATNMIRASGASGACGTLNFTNVSAGGSYTITIPNATASCTILQLGGSTSNVKLPAGYTGGGAVSGIVYTAIYDGTTLWISSVPF